MKMTQPQYAALRKACSPHGALLNRPELSAERNRWDMLHASRYDTHGLFRAGLNDDHIDTALRKIAREMEG